MSRKLFYMIVLVSILLIIMGGCRKDYSQEYKLGENTVKEPSNSSGNSETQGPTDKPQDMGPHESEQVIPNPSNNDVIKPDVKIDMPEKFEEDHKVDQVEPMTEMQDLVDICHYSYSLYEGEVVLIPYRDEIYLKFIEYDLEDPNFAYILYNQDKSQSWEVHDWAKIQINDQEVIFPVRQMIDVSLKDGVNVSVGVSHIRDGKALICVDTKEEVNIDYCEGKEEGYEREMCLDNLGYANGIEYCQQIEDSRDRMICEGGATGGNG